MPFTSPARFRLADPSEEAEPVQGYAVVFNVPESGWIVDWYDDATGIQLPDTKEWLSGAQPHHTWFGGFVPRRGESVPTVPDGTAVQLELSDGWHDTESIGAMQWAPGSTPWLILAGAAEMPAEPERFTGQA